LAVKDLDRMFQPRRVAVVGASPGSDGAGNVVLRNLVGSGFGGVVYPISPEREAVEGIAAYPALDELPATPDMAVVCAPAGEVPAVVRACAESGIAAVAVLSAGFSGPGSERERRLGSEAAAAGVRVLGPNSVGFMVPDLGLNASLAGPLPPSGRVALVSQSGALTGSIVEWARRKRVGLSCVLSLGDMVDVDLGDAIDFLAEDAGTRAIVLLVESVTNARKFMSAARAFARRKPIVAYRPAWAEALHGSAREDAVAGSDAVHRAAFERAGIVRVDRIEEVLGTAELLARERLPRGPRLALVASGCEPLGGVQALLRAHAEPAPLSAETFAEVDSLLGERPRRQPIEVPSDAPAELYAAVAELVLRDGSVDALLVVLTPRLTTDAGALADALAGARRVAHKPLIVVWMGGPGAGEGLARLAAAGVVARAFPEHAVGQFAHLVRDASIRELLYETPRAIPFAFALDRPRADELLIAAYRREGELLSPDSAAALLEAYGIPTAEAGRAEAGGLELALSSRKDRTFGAVIVVGAGGLAWALTADQALELAPLNERLASRMLRSLRVWPLLRGERGHEAADVERLLELLIRFSYLVADHAEIASIDANPLLAGARGAVAVGSRVVLDPELVETPPARFSHLSIRPYPEEYTTTAELPDGRTVTLRPIKPEDEPLWHEMIAACSEDSMRLRFRALLKASTHELATRFCFIDYDREIAIVAELEQDGRRRLAGIGGLIADPDHRRAEFAILIADAWQQVGLSDPLTDYCLAIAHGWGVEEVFAETTPGNPRMLALMKRHGFEVHHRDADEVVGERRLRASPR
jgi:acetyltransferase